MVFSAKAAFMRGMALLETGNKSGEAPHSPIFAVDKRPSAPPHGSTDHGATAVPLAPGSSTLNLALPPPSLLQVATTIHRLASGARWSKYAAQLAFHGIEASQVGCGPRVG